MNFTGFPLECLQRLPISLCEEASRLASDGEKVAMGPLIGHTDTVNSERNKNVNYSLRA